MTLKTFTSEPIEKNVYHGFFKNGGTDELRLDKDGYDSKVAARTMHIEPIVKQAVRFIVEEADNMNLFAGTNHMVYCLFDYQNRNPLSKDADVIILSHL